MSVTRGMGAAVWLALRSQYQEASGTEIAPNNLFTSWTGAYPAQTPNGWLNGSPNTVANHIEPGAGGTGLRIVSDGTYVSTQVVGALSVGHTYQYRVVVSTVSSGSIQVSDGTSAVAVISATGTYNITFVATGTLLQLKRQVACDVTITFFSVQEVVMKTLDVGDYCDTVAYLLSNRGGAQECASLTKLETVDRHTGVVTTVADFSASPGAGAVITPPTGWVYTCPTAGRTTQTSTSTLVTGLGANAAPWRDAGGGKGLAVESQRTNALFFSTPTPGSGGWTAGSATRVGGAADPAGGVGAREVTTTANGQFSDYYGSGAIERVVSAWIRPLTANGAGKVAKFISRGGGGPYYILYNAVGDWRRGSIYDPASTYIYHTCENAGDGVVIDAVSAWREWGFQSEAAHYPSSLIPTTGAAVTRSAATLTCPLDVCNTLSGKIPRITWVPHFAYNESLLDADVVDDGRARLYYQQSSQKFVYEVRGKGSISSLACTFSREQSIVLSANLDEASGLMSLSVAGATTGSGLFQTYASPRKYVLVGDGYTASKMPAQAGPSISLRRGSTNPTDLRYLKQNTLRLGNDGTLVCQWVLATPQFAAASVAMELGSGGLVNGGALLYFTHGVQRLEGYWGGAAASVLANVATPGVHTFMLSCIAGQMTLFCDGRLVAGPTAAVGAVTKTDWACMGDPGLGYNSTAGVQLHASVWPFGFTPQQAKVMHSRLMAEVST